MTKHYSHIYLILLWLYHTHRPPLCRARKKEGDDSDPPQKWGLPGGRYRRYLSLREGSGTDKIKVPGVSPFLLAK